MKVVGLTGGIGSGKSSVLAVFQDKGIPVFNADKEAKLIMDDNAAVDKELKKLFGAGVFTAGKLDKKQLAAVVFSDPDKLAQLNGLIHPLVANRFELFKNQQNTPYLIKEAAILFETGLWKKCDQTILVCASEEQRIQRVMKRDQTTRDAVVLRINNQWPDSEKIPLADFVIQNDHWDTTLLKIDEIHQQLLEV